MDKRKNPSTLSSSDRGRDDRTQRLLRICSELEQYETKMAPDDFMDWIESAVLACGFRSVLEACECLLGPELFRQYVKIMQAVAQEKEEARTKHVDEGFYGRFVERYARRQKTRHC